MTGTSSSQLEFTTSWDPDHRLRVHITNGQARHADRLDPVSARSRKQFMETLLKAIPGLSTKARKEIEDRLLALAAEGPPTSTGPDPTDADLLANGDKATQAKLDETPPEVLAEAAALLADPLLVDRVVEHIAAIGVTGEQTLSLTKYLIGTSRLLRKPLAACVQGGTSTGKSYVIEQVTRLFPPEAVLVATSLTENALYYLEPGALMHRLVCAGERKRKEDDVGADRTRALREMISSGELRKMLPEKQGDVIVTRVIRSPGPIAYVESTTVPEFFAEDANRMLLLGTDDSSEQTRRILTALATRAARGGSDSGVDHLIDVHHALQRMLRRVEVRVPFAPRLLDAIPADLPEARRAAGLVLGAVHACALLHQRQRAGGDELVHGDTIDATVEDYEIVRGLLIGPLGRMLGGGLPAHTHAFGTWLLAEIPIGIQFEAPAALLRRKGCRWHRSQVGEHVKRLVGAGTLERISKGIYRVAGPLPEGGATWLPGLEVLA